MNIQFLIQLLVNGLVVGTLYGVVAMSFVLIYKATQVVNFAQGELLLIGAWVCWVMLNKFQVPFWLGMPLTLVFMFVFGIAIQIVILRPMIGEPIISVIMVTIGLSTVFQAALKWMFGVNPQPFPRVFQNQSVELFGLQIQTVYVMSLIVSVLMMIGMAWFFRASKYGLAMRATAFNQQVAQVARHFRQERVRDGLGNLGSGLRTSPVSPSPWSTACRRASPPTASRSSPPRSSEVSTRSAAPCSAASSSGSWKTSPNMSTASICTGAISTRSRRSTS